jgi:hypothetical protein
MSKSFRSGVSASAGRSPYRSELSASLRNPPDGLLKDSENRLLTRAAPKSAVTCGAATVRERSADLFQRPAHPCLRTLGCALLAILACMQPACRRHQVAERQTVEEPSTPAVSSAPSLASTVHMGDPKVAAQLVAGFHDIESNAWRWSKRQFSVNLRPPVGSAQKGAMLALSLTVPPVVIETEKSITLTAFINGAKLSTETWSKPGPYVFKSEIPAALLTGDGVRVDFELDKAMPPGEKDARELGVVVSKVGLESK